MKKTPTSRRIVGTCAVVAALALAGCGTDDVQSAGGTVTLHVWARDGGLKLDDQVAKFEKAHPTIRVDVSTVQGDQYLAKLANSIRAGTAPDLISFDMVNAPLLAAQGVLADVTDRAQSMPELDDLAPAGVEIGRLDDRIYSLPVALNASQMFWNKDLFAQAGMDPDDPPSSLAEVKAAAEKIDALGGDVTGFSTLGGVAQAFTGFPSGWADGGDVFSAEGPDQRATFTDPSMLDMVTWYQDMWASGLMQPTD
ncbi:MAG: ABC transporter substrate-binding protein, partial [Actinomycetes bacterium]